MSRRRVLIGLAGFFLACVFYLMVIRRLAPGLPGLPGGGLGGLWLFWLFALCHGWYALGWRHTLIFFAISAVVSWIYEQIGVETGLIYGPYHYNDLLGAKLGHVPIIIPVAWFMMIYPSYTLANLIADGTPTGTRGGVGRVLWLATLSAMIMTAWDVVVDPTFSSVMQAWTWEQGGEYFGVPLQNYSGWLLTTFTVYLIYRFYERRTPPRPAGAVTPFATAMAVFGYVTFALPTVIQPSIEELRVIAFFVMGLPALAAAGKISRAC
ncbi:MAG TPA: carotenoid biosynthesis protein [Roseiflexaceae bacterium]|nr:carotenoid biosynthesis protein [Roseiflexaceae bacterium]